MSRRPPRRCAWCLNLVDNDGPRVLAIHMREPGCAVTLRWCLPCAEKDPLNLRLAEAEGAPVTDAGDPVADAYEAVVERAAGQGEDVLRAVVDVHRDLDDPRRTLRGPGLLWGRPAARVR